MEFPFEEALKAALCSAFLFQVATTVFSFSHYKRLQSKHLFRDTLLLYDPPFKLQALSRTAHLSFFVAVLIEVSWARSFSDACVDISEFSNEEEAMNPDIGGVGVRYSMHIMAVMTILRTVANHFGVEGFGVKELCVAQLISLAALALNMVMALALGRKTLSFHSALTAAMTTVECFAALAMTLSQKESLAARFFIFTTSLVSLICLAATFVFMSSIHEYGQGTECCARVIWWGVIDCEGVSPTFWLYLAYRGLFRGCNTLVCLILTGPFDKAGKKDHETHASTDSDNDHEQEKNDKTKELRREYTDMPATVDLHYLDWVLDCLSSITSLEIMLRRFGLPKDEGLDKWGQAVQMVLCIAGILHLCFNVYKHCKHGWQRPRLLHATLKLHHVSFWWNYEAIVREIGLEWRLPAVEGGGLLSRFKARAATMLQHTLTRGEPASSSQHSKDNRSPLDVDNGHELYQGHAGIATGVSAADQDHQGLYRRRTGAEALIDQRDDEFLNYAWKGNEASVRDILNQRTVIDAKDTLMRQAALCMAAEKGHIEIVKLLLDAGQDINAHVASGLLPLIWAASGGHDGVVKLLLENGADIEAVDANRTTALMKAAEKGHIEIVKLLLDAGDDINTHDILGQTPLIRAASCGHDGVVKLLLENGADVKAKDCHGGTALTRAVWRDFDGVVELLLMSGADIEAEAICGETGLMNAVRQASHRVIRVLSKYGADIEAKDTRGETVSEMAVEDKRRFLLDLLLSRAATKRKDQ